MNIRARIGKLEMAIGKCLPLWELSDAELAARIRKAAGLDDDVELTDELLCELSAQTHLALSGGDQASA